MEDILADGKAAEATEAFTLEAIVMADLVDMAVIVLLMVSISPMLIILSVLRNRNILDMKGETTY